LEASVLLSIANICIRALAFRHIDRILRVPWQFREKCRGDESQELTLVNRSVARAANLLPCNSLCLSRSIAAFVMLRRRGIPGAILMGVAFAEDRSLQAHAWVETGKAENHQLPEKLGFTPILRIG